MTFINYIKSNKIVGLAPMDGFTDEPARLVQVNVAKPDIIFTEFVCAEGISRGSEKLFDQLLYSKVEHPIIAQLFGKDIDSFYKASIICFELGFDGVDINMGCPASKVVRHGGGASLINTKLSIEILKSVLKARDDWWNKECSISNIGLKRKSLRVFERNLIYCQYKSDKRNYPTVSVKTRLGIDNDISNIWVKKLAKSGIDVITLHGRTLKQGYAGKADWKAIRKACLIAKKINKTIVFWGNGDVNNKKEANKFIKKYLVDGILIGRASVGNPWVFEEKEKEKSFFEKYRTMLFHAQLFKNIFPQRSLEHMRSKFLYYCKGHKKAKSIRKKIISISSIDDLINLENEFLD